MRSFPTLQGLSCQRPTHTVPPLDEPVPPGIPPDLPLPPEHDPPPAEPPVAVPAPLGSER